MKLCTDKCKKCGNQDVQGIKYASDEFMCMKCLDQEQEEYNKTEVDCVWPRESCSGCYKCTYLEDYD